MKDFSAQDKGRCQREHNQASIWMRGTASQKAWSRDEQGLIKRKFILVHCLLDQKGQPQLGLCLNSHCKCNKHMLDRAEWKVTLK